MSRDPADLCFLLVANGAADSPPASGLRDWLVRRGAQVTYVLHPLGPEEGGRHTVLRYADGRQAGDRSVRLPSRPPFTYPLDLAVPPLLPRADVVVAFNNLHAARALVTRRPRQVVYWAVDFVTDRFGAGTPLTRAYDALDAWVCRHADARFEVSEAALDARDALHGRSSAAAPARVVPIGTWLDRVPTVPEDGCGRRRVVFIGHLVERMGGRTVVEALGLLARRGVAVTGDIAGRGPEEDALRARAAELGLGDRLTFHGFISGHERLEALLATASVALAPYSTTVESFTRYADPSKLKSYLGAGLPILLTDVPPNAAELAAHGGAEVVADTPEAFADAIERLLADEDQWRRRRAAALDYVKRFDWDVVLCEAFAPLGISAGGRPRG